MDDFQRGLNEIQNRVLAKAMNIEEKTTYTENLFESIKHVNEHGEEYWHARELQGVLEYAKWENFSKVIDKAKEACKSSENNSSHHFADVRKTIIMPKNATKEIEDFMLSRYFYDNIFCDSFCKNSLYFFMIFVVIFFQLCYYTYTEMADGFRSKDTRTFIVL